MSKFNEYNSDFFTKGFLDLNLDDICKELKDKGYFAFPKAINSDAISNIHKEATKNRINFNKNEITGVYAEKQYYLTNLLAVSGTFYDFVTSKIIFDICKKYLSNKFRLKALRYYETYGKHKMQWHSDNKTDHRFAQIPGLIFIFYISDVEEGQFQYIEGSHLWSGKKGHNNYSDEFIEQNYRDKVKDFKFPSGSLIIYNTYGIHRAKPVLKNNFVRKSVFFQVDSEVENSEPIILNAKFIKNVDDNLKMFFGFGKKSDYGVFPKTSINSLSFNKVTKLFFKYLAYKFLNNLKIILPKKIKTFIKKFLK